MAAFLATAAHAQDPRPASPPVAPVASEPIAPSSSPATPQSLEPAASQTDGQNGETPQQQISLPDRPSQLLPSDLSPWGMFLSADIVVKAVMVGLAVASSLVWMIWISKWIQIWWARRHLRADLAAIRAQTTLDAAWQSIPNRRSIAQSMLRVAIAEKQLSAGALGSGALERIHSKLGESETGIARQMRSGMSFLATVGATGPFIGLFGTVWGIMNSFIGISRSQTTNLAVVAPGIAEALLATALGLVAAIPAVILYNNLGKGISSYRRLTRETRGEIERIASREMEASAVVRRPSNLASAAE